MAREGKAREEVERREKAQAKGTPAEHKAALFVQLLRINRQLRQFTSGFSKLRRFIDPNPHSEGF